MTKKLSTTISASLAFLTIAYGGATRADATPVVAEPAIEASQSLVQRISVEVTGEGAPVILIPGLASSADVWDRTVEQLSATHEVHTVQVGGFAGAPSGDNAGEGALAAVVDELAAYIEAEGLEQPALIGHSMGGLISLMIAEQYPDLPGKVMSVDSLPYYAVMMMPGATVEAMQPMANNMYNQVVGMSDEQFDAMQARGIPGLVASPEGQKVVTEWSASSDKDVVARFTQALLTTDARDGLAQIKAPVTVVYAYNADMGVSQSVIGDMWASNYEGLEGVELRPVTGSRHFIMFDRPEAFAAEVAAFLTN